PVAELPRPRRDPAAERGHLLARVEEAIRRGDRLRRGGGGRERDEERGEDAVAAHGLEDRGRRWARRRAARGGPRALTLSRTLLDIRSVRGGARSSGPRLQPPIPPVRFRSHYVSAARARAHAPAPAPPDER